MASVDALDHGEKKDNYASSSDSEGEDAVPSSAPPPVSDGLPQTGPKGVLTDFYRQQYEDLQQQAENDKKTRAEIERKAPTVKTWREEHQQVAEDPYIQQYREKRLQELKEQSRTKQKRLVFGSLMEVRGDKYASVIDLANPDTTVVLHIYDDFLLSCKMMNDSLVKLAKAYQTVKFCRVQSHELGVSDNFSHSGLPTLLVYKNGELLGNFVRITDSLGEDFNESDVESFLQDHNCLPSEDLDILPPIASHIVKKLSVASAPDDSD